MLTLLTSCGRHDLLQKTIDSLNDRLEFKNDLYLFINEDSDEFKLKHNYRGKCSVSFTKGIGQHASIEMFLKNIPSGYKYYLHLEDDWEFNNTYDWILKSIEIMEKNPDVIKVLCRAESPHPCVHDPEKGYGFLEPWTSSDEIKWHGFSWNPGVTRIDLLKKFVPFKKWEQEVAADIFNAGYKVVELSKPVYKHIGNERSTHQ